MGFSTFLLWLSWVQPFPEQMPLIQEGLLPPLYLNAGYTAPLESIEVLNHAQGMSNLGFGVIADQPWRPPAIVFHLSHMHSFARLELLQNPVSI